MGQHADDFLNECLDPYWGDWTGSESQRREQGGCINYGTYPEKTPRFVIPAGTGVSVARLNDPLRRYYPYTTKQDVPFDKNEGGRSGAVVVRCQGWLILTRWNKVRKQHALTGK